VVMRVGGGGGVKGGGGGGWWVASTVEEHWVWLVVWSFWVGSDIIYYK
jgi:hypothetical protein